MTDVASRFGRSHALVIGVDHYAGGIPTLANAVADAVAVADRLRIDHGFAVELLRDGEATGPAVRAALAGCATLGPADRLLVYLAGHGLATASTEGPTGYLLFHDAVRDDLTSFVEMSEVRAIIERLACRHALVVLDCCFAGAFRWARRRDVVLGAGPASQARFDRYCTSPAWQVIASAASGQQALDAFGDRSQAAHSPFAAGFLAGLAGRADRNGDGLITATELHGHALEHLEAVLGAAAAQQTPGLFTLARHERGEFVFRVPGRDLALAASLALRPGDNPYRGLQSFDADHRRLLFGRDEAIADLKTWIAGHALTVVVGRSGSGKSSLVNAGVVPALAVAPRVVCGPWRALDALRTDALAGPPPPGELVVVIDQLEELDTHLADPALQARFLADLARWLDAGPRVRFVVTIRSDLETRLALGSLEARWRDGRFVVPAMTQDQMRLAIEEPANARELYFRPARIVDELINELVEMPGALPLLSFTLAALYERSIADHPDDRAITRADMEHVGGVTRALTLHAGAALRELEASDAGFAQTARRVMLRMVAPAGRDVARRRVARDDLAFGTDEDDRVKRFLEHFERARLLVGDHDGTAYVEPAHDELVRSWDRVAVWYREVAAELPILRAAESDAATWRHERKAGYLWSGDPRLNRLLAIAKRDDRLLNLHERAFATRSRMRRRNAAAIVIAVLSAGLIVLGAAAAIAFAQRDEATYQAGLATHNAHEANVQTTLARARQLASAAQAAIAGGTQDRALLLAVAASRAPETPEALRTLASALQAYPQRERFVHGHHGGVTALAIDPRTGALLAGGVAPMNPSDVSATMFPAPQLRPQDLSEDLVSANMVPRTTAALGFAPDGSSWALLDTDGQIYFGGKFDSMAGSEGSGYANALAFSPDGTRLAVGGKTLALLDLTGDYPKQAFTLGERDVAALAFSADGKQVIAGAPNGDLAAWDLAARRELPPVHAHAAAIRALARCGDLVATGSEDRSVRLWSVAGGLAPRGAPLIGHAAPVVSAGCSDDGALLATADTDEVTYFWDVRTGRRLGRAWGSRVALGHGRIATGAPDSDSVSLWNPAASELVAATWTIGRSLAIAYAPDGRVLAQLRDDGAVELWRVADHQVSARLSGPWPEGDRVDLGRVAFSADGGIVAATGPQLRLWDLATGAPFAIRCAPDGGGPITDLAFGPDGAIATAGGAVQFWTLRDRTATCDPAIAAPETYDVQSIDFTRSGAAAVAHATREMTGQPAWYIFDRRAGLVGAQAGTPIPDLEYAALEPGAAHTRDWKLGAYARRTEIDLVDLGAGALIGRLHIEQRIAALSVRSDRGEIAAVTDQGEVTLWDVAPASWKQRACRIARRNLSDVEWKTYVGYTPDRPDRCPDP